MFSLPFLWYYLFLSIYSLNVPLQTFELHRVRSEQHQSRVWLSCISTDYLTFIKTERLFLDQVSHLIHLFYHRFWFLIPHPLPSHLQDPIPLVTAICFRFIQFQSCTFVFVFHLGISLDQSFTLCLITSWIDYLLKSL